MSTPPSAQPPPHFVLTSPKQSIVAKPPPALAFNFVNDDLLAKRRDRKPNWTDREVARLIQLHHLYRNTLNSSGHDAGTIALKQNVWLRITRGLNSTFPGHPQRSYREVQKKWGNLKSEAKKRAQFALLHQLDPATEVASILPQEVISSMSNAVIKTELLDNAYSPLQCDATSAISAIEESPSDDSPLESTFQGFITTDIDFSTIQQSECPPDFAEGPSVAICRNDDEQDDASLNSVIQPSVQGPTDAAANQSVSTSTESDCEEKSCQTDPLVSREDLERRKLEEEILLLREQKRFWAKKRQLKVFKLQVLRKMNNP